MQHEEEDNPKPILFARAPFANEILVQENFDKFNNREPYQRQLIKKLIEHGNLERAISESGISKEKKDSITIPNKDLKESLKDEGISFATIASHLKECLSAQEQKVDKKGTVYSVVDYKTKLAAIKTIIDIFSDKGSGDSELEKAKKLTELFKDE